MQLPLVGTNAADTIGEVRDALDRHYTPMALARICLDALVLDVPGLAPRVVIEPSVGGGAFAVAARHRWSGVRVIGYDVDPRAAGQAVCHEFRVEDWPSTTATADVIVGNPPFTGRAGLAHVERSLAAAPVVGLILPWAPLGGVEAWAHLLDEPTRPAIVRAIRPRPWGEHIREVAWFVWLRDHRGATRIERQLVGEWA